MRLHAAQRSSEAIRLTPVFCVFPGPFGGVLRVIVRRPHLGISLSAGILGKTSRNIAALKLSCTMSLQGDHKHYVTMRVDHDTGTA
jgi:hypothetical protein